MLVAKQCDLHSARQQFGSQFPQLERERERELDLLERGNDTTYELLTNVLEGKKGAVRMLRCVPPPLRTRTHRATTNPVLFLVMY